MPTDTAINLKRRHILATGCILASVAFVMELTLLPLGLTAIQADLNLTLGELAWVYNAYAVSVAIAVMVSGLIGDRVDHHKLFLLGVALFFFGSLISSASSDFDFLMFGRVVQGAGGGLFSPLIPVLLTQSYPDRHGSILMIWGALVGILATILPFFAAVIISTFGWEALFYAFSLLSLASFLYFCGAAQDRTEPRAPRSLALSHLARSSRIWAVLIYIFVTYGIFSFTIFFVSTELQTSAYNAQDLTLILSMVWFSFSAISLLFRNGLDDHRIGVFIVLSPILMCAGFLIAVQFAGSLPMSLLASVLIGAGFACSNSPSTHLVLKFAPKGLQTISSSLDITFARLGGVACVAAFSGLGPVWASSAVVAATVIAIICWRQIPMNPQSPAP